MSVLRGLLDLLRERPPTLGEHRLISIDGPAGSGKTTLAGAVAAGFAEREGRAARIVHMDDLFAGWSGLPRVDEQLDGLLTPLSQGRPGSYRRFDWVTDEYAETVLIEPVPLLVLEGVGSGSSRFDDLRTVLAWVEASYDERLRRGLERDGEAFAPHWEQWARDERAVFERDRTRERADLRVDGTVPH